MSETLADSKSPSANEQEQNNENVIEETLTRHGIVTTVTT